MLQKSKQGISEASVTTNNKQQTTREQQWRRGWRSDRQTSSGVCVSEKPKRAREENNDTHRLLPEPADDWAALDHAGAGRTWGGAGGIGGERRGRDKDAGPDVVEAMNGLSLGVRARERLGRA